MPERAARLRQQAAECLAMARDALNEEMRVGLVTLAQKLHQLAETRVPSMNRLHQAVDGLNDDKMSQDGADPRRSSKDMSGRAGT